MNIKIRLNGAPAKISEATARDAMIEMLILWSEPKWERSIEKHPPTFSIRENEAILHAL